MYRFKTLKCSHCQSVILNLPEGEVSKLEGLSFHCENCGHHNTLAGFEFRKHPGYELLNEVIVLETTYTDYTR